MKLLPRLVSISVMAFGACSYSARVGDPPDGSRSDGSAHDAVVPGACTNLPRGEAATVRGRVATSRQEPAYGGGTIVEGTYALTDMVAYRTSPALPVHESQPLRSLARFENGRFEMWVEAPTSYWDVNDAYRIEGATLSGDGPLDCRDTSEGSTSTFILDDAASAPVRYEAGAASLLLSPRGEGGLSGVLVFTRLDAIERPTSAECAAVCACSTEPGCAAGCADMLTYSRRFWERAPVCRACGEAMLACMLDHIPRDGSPLCAAIEDRQQTCGLASVDALCAALSAPARDAFADCLTYTDCGDYLECVRESHALAGLPRSRT